MGEVYKLSPNSETSQRIPDDLDFFSGQRISKDIFEDRYGGRTLDEVASFIGLTIGDTFQKTTSSGTEIYNIVDMLDVLDETGYRMIQVRIKNTKTKQISIISAHDLIAGKKDKSIKKVNV